MVTATKSMPSNSSALTRVGTVTVALLILVIAADRYALTAIADVEPRSLFPFQRYLVIYVSDFVLVMAGIIGLGTATASKISGWRTGSAGFLGSVAFATFAVIAFAVNPSLEAFVFTMRIVLGVGVVALILDFDQRDFTGFFLWPLAILITVQSVWATLQVFVLHSGLGRLWQLSDGTSGLTSAYGTTLHPYFLGFLLTVGVSILLASYNTVAPRWTMGIPAGLGMFGVALTYGRMAAVAVVLIGGTYLVAAIARRSRDYGFKAMIVTIPFTIGVAMTSEPWFARLGKTTGSGSIDRASSGRIELMEIATEMIRARPWFGYGMRQWVTGLADVRDTWTTSYAVHNIPLLVGAEMGIAAMISVVVWYGVLFWRAIRTSAGAIAIFLSAIPVLMLDKMTLDATSMMIVAVLWIAALDWHWQERHQSAEQQIGTDSK